MHAGSYESLAALREQLEAIEKEENAINTITNRQIISEAHIAMFERVLATNNSLL